jgi:hypothetical protein
VPQHNPYSFESPLNSLEATKRTHTTPKQPARANASGLCEGGCVWFADVRVTTKRGYGCASVAERVEKRANKNVKLIVLFSETETAKQNQKFPFHFFFRFAAEGWGEEARGKCKEIFWFLHTRVRERVRGAFLCFTTQSERTRQFQATTRSARAISRHQDYQQNTFELCLIHTAEPSHHMKKEKSIQQFLGKYYIAIKIIFVVMLLLGVRYIVVENSFDFITLNSLSSSIIAGAVFITGFLLAGVFSDYKEVDKLPAEIRAIIESILSEGDTLYRKDPAFKEGNQTLKNIAVRFIKEFEDGLSHTRDHAHIEHALDEIKNFDLVFDEMEKRGVPPNYMTRIKSEQSNLKKILLRVYHIQKTKFVPSVVFLVDSIVVLVVLFLLFSKTEVAIGYVALGLLSYILLYIRRLIIVLEKPFRKGKDDTDDDVSIFVLRELRESIEK